MGKRKKTGGGEKKENAERTKRIRGLCPFRSVLYQKRLILIYFYRTDAYTVIPFLFCFCCPESDGDAHSHIIQYFIQRLTFESRSVSELVDRRVFQDETYPVTCSSLSNIVLSGSSLNARIPSFQEMYWYVSISVTSMLFDAF